MGRDEGQLRRYKEHFGKEYGKESCVKSIYGRSSDLSLECIASRLTSDLDAGTLGPQPELSVRLLRKLIEQALGEATSGSKPVRVSEQMKDHWLVRRLTLRLGDRLDFDLQPAVPGCLKVNARGERGFSLRVYSPIPSGREVSVLYFRCGAKEVRFASRAHLERYLSNHRAEAIAAWCNLVRRIGGDIEIDGETQVPIHIQRTAFEEHETELAKYLVTLSSSA